MAAMPAYRYDYTGSAQPARRGYEVPQSPQVRIIRGRKTKVNPPISDKAVFAVRALLFLMVALLVMGFIRVSIAAVAYSTASQASELRAQISTERSQGENLLIQESQIVSDANTKSAAMEKYGLVEPSTSAVISLPLDIVATDSEGNLSLAQSVANAAAQG